MNIILIPDKLREDFGVSALLGTLIIIGSLTIIGIGAFKGLVSWDILLPMFSAWVGAVIASYFNMKNIKEVIKKLIETQSKGGNDGKTD